MSDQTTIQKGVLMPCCADERNLSPLKELSPGLFVRVCKCGRRHFEANAEPGAYGLKGAGL